MKRVAIIGGGPVGVELAAEVAENFKNKNITLVHAKKELMGRANQSARRYALEHLKKRGVSFYFKERVLQHKGRYYITEKGKKILADLVFLCVGIEPNYEFLKKNFSSALDERNHLKVNSFLQVDGHENIFAAGDITSIQEEKLAQNAEKQGKIAGMNILKIIQKNSLKEYVSKPRVMVISLGRWDGLLTYKNMVLKGLIPGILKTLIEWKTMFFRGILKE